MYFLNRKTKFKEKFFVALWPFPPREITTELVLKKKKTVNKLKTAYTIKSKYG